MRQAHETNLARAENAAKALKEAIALAHQQQEEADAKARQAEIDQAAEREQERIIAAQVKEAEIKRVTAETKASVAALEANNDAAKRLVIAANEKATQAAIKRGGSANTAMLSVPLVSLPFSLYLLFCFSLRQLPHLRSHIVITLQAKLAAAMADMDDTLEARTKFTKDTANRQIVVIMEGDATPPPPTGGIDEPSLGTMPAEMGKPIDSQLVKVTLSPAHEVPHTQLVFLILVHSKQASKVWVDIYPKYSHIFRLGTVQACVPRVRVRRGSGVPQRPSLPGRW